MLRVFAFNAVHTRLFKADVTFKEAMQLSDTGRVAHFAKCLSFNLSDSLAGYLKLSTDFLERAGVAISEPEA
jgi:hypothetical protein